MEGEKIFFTRGTSSGKTDFAFDIQRFAINNSSENALFSFVGTNGTSYAHDNADWKDTALSSATSITLLQNTSISAGILFDGDVVLNLGGSALELDQGVGYAFSIRGGHSMTVNGESGQVTNLNLSSANHNEKFIFLADGANLSINGGTYITGANSSATVANGLGGSNPAGSVFQSFIWLDGSQSSTNAPHYLGHGRYFGEF